MRKRYADILKQINSTVNVTSTLDDHVLLVDGLNNFIRAWSASPATNSDGDHIGGMLGFLQSVGLAIRTIRPTRVIIAFDGPGGSQRRRKIYPGYKDKRKPPKRPHRFREMDNEDDQESLSRQIKRLGEYLQNLPLTSVTIPNIEADDTIGYIAKSLLSNSKITIMSSDKDFLQLVDDRITVWSPTKKILFDRAKTESEYEMLSENLVYYRIIDGDKSDNIPGIKGYGLKTILKKVPFLKDTKITNISDFIVNSGLTLHKELLERNYTLMQLHDVNISGNAKSNIMEIVSAQPSRLVKYKLHTMFLEDKINQSIRNPDVWLQDTFNALDLVIANASSN